MYVIYQVGNLHDVDSVTSDLFVTAARQLFSLIKAVQSRMSIDEF